MLIRLFLVMVVFVAMLTGSVIGVASAYAISPMGTQWMLGIVSTMCLLIGIYTDIVTTFLTVVIAAIIGTSPEDIHAMLAGKSQKK